MPRDFRLYLDDMLDAIHQIRSYLQGWTKRHSPPTARPQDAVIRNLEIIVEAAGNLPDNITQTAP